MNPKQYCCSVMPRELAEEVFAFPAMADFSYNGEVADVTITTVHACLSENNNIRIVFRIHQHHLIPWFIDVMRRL